MEHNSKQHTIWSTCTQLYQVCDSKIHATLSFLKLPLNLNIIYHYMKPKIWKLTFAPAWAHCIFFFLPSTLLLYTWFFLLPTLVCFVSFLLMIRIQFFSRNLSYCIWHYLIFSYLLLIMKKLKSIHFIRENNWKTQCQGKLTYGQNIVVSPDKLYCA